MQDAQYSILANILFTLGIAWATRHFAFSYKSHNEELKTDEVATAVFKRTAAFSIKRVVLMILIPTTIILNLNPSKFQSDGSKYFPYEHFPLAIFAAGFCVLFLFYIVFSVVYGRSYPDRDIWRISASSMGGGNRGIAAVLLVSSFFSSPEMASVALTSFLLLDFGNFIALLALTSKRNESLASALNGDAAGEIKLLLKVVAAVAIILFFMRVIDNQSPILIFMERFREFSSSARSVLLSFLSWLYVFIIIAPDGMTVNQLMKSGKEALKIAFVKLLTLLIVVVLAETVWFFINSQTWKPSEWHIPHMVAMVALFLAPISSLSPQLLGIEAPEVEDELARTILAYTMVYFIIVIIGTICVKLFAIPGFA